MSEYDVDAATYDFLVNEYGDEGGKQAAMEIRHWMITGGLPIWAIFIQQIIVEADGSLTFVHRDSKANDTKGGA